MIRIEKKGRRIEIFSNEPLPGLRSAVPGAYETVSGKWTVPLSIESAKLLQQKFGKRLVIGKELKSWATNVNQNREYMAKLAASKNTRLENLAKRAPKLARAMRKRTYQRVGARFIAENPATLVADDPGLGKTYEAMAGILEAGVPGPYLVVAPKTAADTVWRREISRMLPPEHRAVILPQLRYQRDYRIRITRYTPHTWLIVHPEIVLVQAWWVCTEKLDDGSRCGEKTEMASTQVTDLICNHKRTRSTKKLIVPSYPKLFEINWGAVIIDESHESLIRRKGVPTQRRRGMDMLKLRPDGIKIAMSGTPFDSKPHQLWGTLNWLSPQQYSAFHRWAELYWEKGGYNGFEIGDFRKEREKMLWDSLSAIAIRRTKAEVAKDLPPKIWAGTPYDEKDESSPIGVWLEMESKQKVAYSQMEAESAADLDSGRLDAVTALAALTRLKQMACAYGDITWTQTNGHSRHHYVPRLPSNKFNWIVENLEEWGFPKNPITKVVIAGWFSGILREFAKELTRHFKIKSGQPFVTGISGRTPTHMRTKVIDDFNRTDRNTPQIMMLNVKAGGTAITLDTADRMIFISETRSPDRQQQTEDRIHRISNPRQCLYYYLRSLDTVDIGTAFSNASLERDTHRLLDGRRGIAYVKQILDLSHHRS